MTNSISESRKKFLFICDMGLMNLSFFIRKPDRSLSTLIFLKITKNRKTNLNRVRF